MNYDLIVIVTRTTGVAITTLSYDDIDEAEDAREVILLEGRDVDVLRTYRIDEDYEEEVRD